jgi:hypothetical protein
MTKKIVKGDDFVGHFAIYFQGQDEVTRARSLDDWKEALLPRKTALEFLRHNPWIAELRTLCSDQPRGLDRLQLFHFWTKGNEVRMERCPRTKERCPAGQNLDEILQGEILHDIRDRLAGVRDKTLPLNAPGARWGSL